MRTVRGWVISKEPVSLKKAARIVSSFAARDNFASQDVTNYLKRAAVAFNELLHFHRDLRQGRKPGSFRSEDAAAGDGEPSARKQEAVERSGGKEPIKEKKRNESGRKLAADGGAKVGIFSEKQQVDGVSELLDVNDSKSEVVEVKKSAAKCRKSTMDVVVEGSVHLAVEDNGEKAHIDGGDEKRSKEKRNEKRKNSELNREKMNNREGVEQSEEKIKSNEEGDAKSKKVKQKKKEEIEEHIKNEEERKKREEGKEQNKIEKEKWKNRDEGEEQNKIEKIKMKNSEAVEGQQNEKKKRRKN